jgi:hypothetical protein
VDSTKRVSSPDSSEAAPAPASTRASDASTSSRRPADGAVCRGPHPAGAGRHRRCFPCRGVRTVSARSRVEPAVRFSPTAQHARDHCRRSDRCGRNCDTAQDPLSGRQRRQTGRPRPANSQRPRVRQDRKPSHARAWGVTITVKVMSMCGIPSSR